MASAAYELSEGVSVEELEAGVVTDFEKSQKAFRCGFVRFLPSGQVLPREFGKFEKRIRNFAVRKDDVWIGSFPKCGTVLLCKHMLHAFIVVSIVHKYNTYDVYTMKLL